MVCFFYPVHLDCDESRTWLTWLNASDALSEVTGGPKLFDFDLHLHGLCSGSIANCWFLSVLDSLVHL